MTCNLCVLYSYVVRWSVRVREKASDDDEMVDKRIGKELTDF